MYLAGSSVFVRDLPIVEGIRKMIRMGFMHGDIFAIEGYVAHLSPAALAAGNTAILDELADLLETTGFRVTSLNTGFSHPTADPDPRHRAVVLDEFSALLDAAQRLRCRNITLPAGHSPAVASAGERLDLLEEVFSAMHERRAQRNVALSFEAHAGTVAEDPAKALELLARMGPRIGLTYDPSHFELQGIPLRRTAGLLPYVRHVHVRNASLGKMQVRTSEGTVDFAWLISALAAAGYDGPLAIEYLEPDDAEVARLKACLEGVLLRR